MPDTDSYDSFFPTEKKIPSKRYNSVNISETNVRLMSALVPFSVEEVCEIFFDF